MTLAIIARTRNRSIHRIEIAEFLLVLNAAFAMNPSLSVRLSTHLFLTNRTPRRSGITAARGQFHVHDSGTTREFQGKRRWVRIFVFELQEPLFSPFLPSLSPLRPPSSRQPPPPPPPPPASPSALPSREQGSPV